MKNFDLFVGIDWSGAKKPVQTKAICVALCEQGQTAPVLVHPDHEGYWSRSDVFAWISSLLAEDQRILIGIDANFGYEQDIGMLQFGECYDHLDVWSAVEKSCEDQDNFFAGGFWASETYGRYFWTSGKKPAHLTLPKRKIEQVCGEKGYGWPESPFKLIGPKQVGKGGLSAMRVAHALKKEYGDQICIWPFEREIEDTAQIVITEIYPRQFLKRAGHGNAKIKTMDDLNTALKFFDSKNLEGLDEVTDHQTDALISAAGLRWLCGDHEVVPQEISNPRELDDITAIREGWILGG